MADISHPVLKATVYPYKFFLAPALTGGTSAIFWMMFMLVCVTVKSLNTYMIMFLPGMIISHFTIMTYTFFELHTDTFIMSMPAKTRLNWSAKLIGKNQKGKHIFYPG